MEENKKGLFSKIMDHSMDIALLGLVGTYMVAIITPVISRATNERRVVNNRMNNIKELKAMGANVNVNLKGDI